MVRDKEAEVQKGQDSVSGPEAISGPEDPASVKTRPTRQARRITKMLSVN